MPPLIPITTIQADVLDFIQTSEDVIGIVFHGPAASGKTITTRQLPRTYPQTYLRDRSEETEALVSCLSGRLPSEIVMQIEKEFRRDIRMVELRIHTYGDHENFEFMIELMEGLRCHRYRQVVLFHLTLPMDMTIDPRLERLIHAQYEFQPYPVQQEIE